MRIATESSDLTARARIRDAAIECFAAEGFDASVRTISARAGVSPGLITHHFGSKTALHAECDAEALRRYRELKSATIAQPTERFLASLADPAPYGPLLVYMLRSLQVGGAAGRAFVEHLIDDARVYMTEAVASGMVRPSRDEEARLRYLTYQTMGALLMEFMLRPDGDPADFATVVLERQRSTILPTLELFTEGLLTSSDMLDTYLAYRDSADDEPARAAQAPGNLSH